MNPENKLAHLCITAAMAGLLLASTFNGYMLMAEWPIPYGPGVIAFGTATSAVALVALVVMVALKHSSRLLMLPMFIAGTAPAYCIVIICLAGVIGDHTFRLLTVISITVAIAVITFLATFPSKTINDQSSSPVKKVVPTLGGV